MRTTSRRQKPIGSMLAVGAAVLLIVLAVFFRHGLSGFLWSVGAPLVQMRNGLGGSEVANLKAQLASTTAALADRDLLASENTQLRAELGRAGGKQEILAGIIEWPPGTPYDTLTVDAGQGDGVVVGVRVFAGNVAVGQVDAVYANTARVVLYSAPGQSYQALLAGQKGSVPIVVEGQGAGSMQAQVPAGTEVAVGDAIVFPGVMGGLAAKVSAVSAPQGESC